MQTRRKFLNYSMLGLATTFVGKKNPLLLASDNSKRKLNEPIVLSTWDFGKAANAAAWQILNKGGQAIDAVEAGVKVPEADPNNQSIGYGGLPDRDGRVTLDACIMDHNYNCGAVMCMEHIVHAISVARLVMEKTPHVILVGDGALTFAVANGFKKENLLTPKSEKDWKNWLKNSNYHPTINIENKLYQAADSQMIGDSKNHDTIGMLAMDHNGNLSGACSTSGLAYKMHGRVGDSPVIGAGLYVDNEIGAATATGMGEEVVRVVGAHLIVEFMRQGLSPEEACKAGIERVIKISKEKSKDIQIGFLAVNKNGEYGAYSLQKGFTYSVKNQGVDTVFTAKSYY